MAFTAEEKQRIIELLEQLDEAELKKKLSSLDAFVGWLKSLPNIDKVIERIKNFIESVSESALKVLSDIRDFFGL